MDTDFCDDIDLGRKIFKCVSLKDKVVFIFMNIYFLQNNFEKGDKVTYHLEKGMGYGTISNIEVDTITIKDENGSDITLPRMNVNKVDKIHVILRKIQENIENSKEIFQSISKEDINLLRETLEMDEGDWIDFLSPEITQGYSLQFIFDDTFYEDDTNKNILMKISQRCSKYTFEGHQYIYASYIDLNKKVKAIGFDYQNRELLSSQEIINTKLCDLLKIEEKHTDGEENNIIQHIDKLQELFENNKVLNNTIYFITFNDFVSEKGIDTIYNGRDIDCDDISYQIKPVKNRLINKYWPILSKDETKNIIGDTEIKREEYEKETIFLKQITFPNKVIYGSFSYLEDKRFCDNVELAYFKLNKKSESKNTVDIYKLFLDFKLTDIIPFIKWNGSTYENKYYKIHKESMIYEGYDILRSQKKTIDIHLCQEWTKDFYRNERPILEEMNLFNNLHKTDVLFLKVCSEDNQLIYGTLVIHINGDIEFIIKKNQSDILSVTSKKQIKKLIKTSNTIIKTINEQNIYSENNITDFGKEKQINELLESEGLGNNIDFIDFNVYYDNNNYEVKNGIKQKEYDVLKKKPGFDSLKPPFLLGDRSGLALPLLNKMIKKLPSFFRKIDEIEKDGSLLCHYKKVNDYVNRTTLQSAVEIYSKLSSDGVSESIINKINRDFNGEFTVEEITQEYQSWQEMNSRNENRKDKNIIEENGPDILITNTPSSLVFSVTGAKSFPEVQRILLLTKTMMDIFQKYINQDESIEDNYIKQYFEDDIIDLGETIIQKEPPKKKTLQQLFDDSESDSDSDSESSDDNLPSSDDSDMEGGGGKYDARSYYLKRLKKNDKKLFVFKSEKYQTDKHGNKTNTRYGYPKICQGAKGLGSRQPISVTKEELERIDDVSNEELGSGIESYSGAIQVPGREEVDGKEIFYICPQYWDISKDLPIKSEYIEENYTKEDIIPEVLPKDGMTDNFILERKGTYWDGVPREFPHKYIVPGLLDNIIHPDGYPLPCCFSLAKGSNKSGKTIDEKMKEHFQQFEHKDFKKVEKEKEVKKVTVIVKKEKCNKINTKNIGPLEKGKCSQLPIKLQIMLSQDLIFKYDPELTISNGFIRMGVPQNKGKTIFTESSFINSYIEIIDYKKNSDNFIQEEIIQKLESNLELFQKCSTIQKTFKKSKITKEDDVSYIKEILKKGRNSIFISVPIAKKIKEELGKEDISFDNNKENYFFHLLLTLKNYRDFLLSSEEKKDEYIVPVLNILAEQKINVIIFEKIEDTISIKQTEYTNTGELCFILKDGHYYEPIIYRVNIGNTTEDIKIFSKNKFSTFEYFNKTNFIEHLQTPYPRGRKNYLRSGQKQDKLKNIVCKESDNFCREWLTYGEYNQIIGELKVGSEVKWISNDEKECENDGEKLYGKIKKIVKNDNLIITEGGEKVNFDSLLIKSTNKIPDPELIKGITQKSDWVWIGGNCTEYDRDIEALVRKKYDSNGDKLLLTLSNITKPQLKKPDMETRLLAGMVSNFFIMNKVLDDISKNIQEKIKDKIIDITSYEVDDFNIKDLVINNYSEIVYLIAKKNGEKDRIIPIKPTNILFIETNRKVKVKYSFEQVPDFSELSIYKKEYNLTIEKIIVNSDGFITCVIFDNKTYLPINPLKIKDEYYSNYEVIESNYTPYLLDQKIYGNGIGKNEKSEYISNFNKTNNYKKVLFNHLLNIINTKNISIEGVPKATSEDLNIGEHIHFYKKQNELTYITEDEYYFLEHSLFKKIINKEDFEEEEIPYFGYITKIKGKITIKCTLNDYITKIIKDEIAINQYKIGKLLRIIYSDIQLPNGLSLTKNDIFKVIKSDDFDLLEDYMEYSLNGEKLMNPTFEQKSECDKYIFISDKDVNDNYDEKLILDFINKLILNLNNGKEVRNMNKLVNDIIKISDIEKNTPITEAFYKYSKDKDLMLDTIRTIYTKKSDFTNIIDYEDQEIGKRVQTNKLENIPFYINKLFGYNTTNIFSIDNKGDDWYGLTNALKQIGLPYRGKQNKQMKHAYDTVFITIIYKELNKIIKSDNEEYKNAIVNEYNKYNIMRYGKSFEKYKTIQDIRKYWLKNKERKINIPDIKLLLKSLENYDLDIDLGVLIVSFNGNGKNYIEFLHTEKYYRDTDVILLQHVKYGNDYVLSNISKEGRLSLTVQELYDISEQHKTWIKEDKIKVKECPEKIKQDIQNKIEEKIREKEENNNEIDIEVDYLRNKLKKIEEGNCE